MSYAHLTENDRYVISYLVLAGYSLREIGRRIGKNHTTISREIKRNRPANRDDDDVYWYEISHPMAINRRQQARHRLRQNHKKLIEYVEAKVRLGWPPEAITARLALEYPDDQQMRVSHESAHLEYGRYDTHQRRNFQNYQDH